MKFLKKLRARRKGEILMTPLPKIKAIKVEPEELKIEIVSYSPEKVKKYEETYPGKHAIWRGNYTKQFVKWAEKPIENDSKD